MIRPRVKLSIAVCDERSSMSIAISESELKVDVPL